MFERFSEEARQVVVLAQDEARSFKHDHIGTEHILLGLLHQEQGIAAQVLGAIGLSLDVAHAQVAGLTEMGEETPTGQIPFTPRAKKILELALREALSLGHNYIGSEHILLGLFRENEGVAAQILREFDVDERAIYDQIIKSLRGANVASAKRAVPEQGGDERRWRTCSKCVGSAIGGREHCFVHATAEERTTVLGALATGLELDLRGVALELTDLEAIFAAAPDRDGHVLVRGARFESASFPDGTSFAGVVFEGVSFRRATFGRGCSFEGAVFEYGWVPTPRLADVLTQNHFGGATFGADANFAHAVFAGQTSFADARFGDRCSFETTSFEAQVDFRYAEFGDGAKFAGLQCRDWAAFGHSSFGEGSVFTGSIFRADAEFRGARFGQRTTFAGATFGNRFEFDRAIFEAEASFERANLGAIGSFRGATFGPGSVFRRATFTGDVSFARTRFDEGSLVGPLVVNGEASFEQAIFGRGSRIAVSSERLVCTGVAAPDGVTIEARWCEIELDSARFNAASSVSGYDAPFDGVDEASIAEARRDEGYRPRLLSLANTDVQHLVVGNVDLRVCRFAGARNLDRLVLERPLLLPGTPRGLCGGRAIPPVWWWTERETLPEEHEWHRGSRKRRGWLEIPRIERSATTRDDDNALQRTVEMLRGTRDRLEARYRIKITDEALVAAALLTVRHVTDDEISARSLDVINSTAARASASVPVPAVENPEVTALRSAIDDVRTRKEEAIEGQEFDLAAQLRDRERKLTAKLRELQPRVPRWQPLAADEFGDQPEIGAAEVADLVSRWVGIPSAELVREIEGARPTPLIHPGGGSARHERRVVAGHIASLYRALRKGRESERDAPGAADFYYGEMEMRRKAAPRGIERVLLWIYWAAAGYGLRASRPFLLLVALLALDTYFVRRWAFEGHRPIGRSITFTVSNALLRGASNARLTVWGEALQISLRLAGPLLLALTLLSLRGRLKR